MTLMKIGYKEIPSDWALCLAGECPQAEECLRHVSHTELPRGLKEHNCVLPEACSHDGRCPLFASMEPVVMARGMKSLLSDVQEEDVRKMRNELIQMFGERRRYYRFREGRWPIAPAMQEAIAQMRRKYGYTAAPQFDQTMRCIHFPNEMDCVFPHGADVCDTGDTIL